MGNLESWTGTVRRKQTLPELSGLSPRTLWGETPTMIQHKLALCLLAAAFAAASIPAQANNDRVQFSSNINISAGETAHDTVCFFCSVHVDGKVTGDIVVFFGNIHLNGDAQHDVVDFFGKVTAESNASIGNSLVSFFGVVRLGENVTVGRDLVAMFGNLHAAQSVSVGGNRVVQPGWILYGPLLFVIFIVWLIVHEFRAYRHRLLMRGYNFPPRQ